jgi:hypothetical protein
MFVTQSRLVEPEDLNDWYPELRWGNRRQLVSSGAGVLMADPTYLADVYNEADDPVAAVVRAEGVILSDFGGDASTHVLWKPPWLKLPLSMHSGDGPAEGESLPGAEGAEIVGLASCDSGSLVFLALDAGLPAGLREQVDGLVDGRNASILRLPPGTYRFHYEQFDPPQANQESLYRNIVARRQER